MKSKRFWRFVNEAGDDNAELLLYGAIASQSWYDDDVTPRQFNDDLKECGGKNLTVRINSPGGDVFAAQAIYTMLKGYSGKKTMHIDGMCASAATIIACAGDSVEMPRNALYMIHNPASFLIGGYDEQGLAKLQKALASTKETILNVYAERCHKTTDELAQMMDDETWMTADQALENGFIDAIDEDYQVTASLNDNMLIVNNISCPCHMKNRAQLEKIINKGEKNMDDKTLASKLAALLGLNPQNANKDADESKRIAELKALKNGNVYTDAMIDRAISDGRTADDVAPYIEAVAGVQPPSDQALASVRTMIMEQMQSGSEQVTPVPKTGMPQNQAAVKKAQDIEDVVNAANRLRGAK